MDDPLDPIRWRDELLQILYWLRGEGLGEAVTPQDLMVFLDVAEDVVQLQLDRLVEEGYAAIVDGSPRRYRLTGWGVQEGGRRFADEFAALTRQAHGACNNPKCSCHSLGPQACEEQRHM
ncbi:MAG: hypothetical protein KatS3mg057_2017 [Herpetosiphonaceae bacterium]|nr:MAG: hypothetical protein KatS3mg057_2017 [Herpetosiphonaceae bacterium]